MREGGYMQICSIDVGVCAHIIWHTFCTKRDVLYQTADLSFFCFTSLCSWSNLACFSKNFLRNGYGKKGYCTIMLTRHIFRLGANTNSLFYLSSSSDSSCSSSSWESSASSDGPSSDIICREVPRLFTDDVIIMRGVLREFP